MDSSFPHIQEHIEKIKLLKPTIVEQWIGSSALQPVMEKYNMEPGYFKRHYAGVIVDNLLKPLNDGNEKEGDDAISEFMDYMKNRDVIMEDLFVFYSTFSQAALQELMKRIPDENELYLEFQKLSDQNFHNAIAYFNRMIFSQKGEYADQLQLFHEYQKVIDRSAIVSKADTRGVITYVNAAFVAISGYTREELIGKPHSIVRHPDMDASVFAKLWKTIKAKKVFHGVLKNRKRNGETYYVDTTIVPILDRENEIVEYIAMRYDVTKFAEAVLAAKQAQKAKDEFLSNMSHEIRTPLNAIMGFVQILRKTIKEPKDLEKLEVVYQSSQGLLHIINDILDFSKIESGHFKIDLHECDLQKEFTALMELFRLKMQEKEITFLTYLAPELPRSVNIDALRVKQIVSNLLDNAVKFTPNEGTVTVDMTYERSSGQIKIAVKDSGIGIAKEQLETIFHPFQQADGSISRKFGGTGLGLSISQKLAELMDGRIEVRSKENEGSTFTLTLPVMGCEKPQTIDYAGLKKLRVAVCYTDATKRDKAYFTLFKRYLKAWGVRVNFINWLEGIDYDYVVFNGLSIMPEALETITRSKAKAIALMPMHNDLFEEQPDVKVLTYPLSAVKIYQVLGQASALLKRSSDASASSIKGKVLVAEDNRSNQQLIELYLDEYGLQVTFANNGIEAVEMFKRVSFDLVLMDHHMPQMNGLEATRLILEHEKANQLEHTPIVALTANVPEGERETFLQAGMDDFLAKPIDTDELDRVLKKYLGMPHEKSGQEEGVSMTLAGIAKEMGIKEKHVKMVLMTFLDEFESLGKKLQEAIEAKEYGKIAYHAHAIKGSAGNLCLKEMAELSKAMELAGKASDATFDYSGTYAQLIALFDEVKAIRS